MPAGAVSMNHEPTMEFLPEPAFPVAEFEGRLAALNEKILSGGLDAMVIHIPENINYISGWHTPGYYYPQMLIVKPGSRPIIILRALEALGLPVRSWFRQDQLMAYHDNESPVGELVEALKRLELTRSRVGLETHGWFFTVDMNRELADRLPDMQLEPSGWLVESLRQKKSPAEIEQIRRACRIAEIGIRAGIDNFRAGMTEAELAGHIHHAMVSSGCEYVGLPIFVMSGHRQLAPHSVWSSEKRIVPGENIFLEVAGSVNRYAGALFRTLVVGPPTQRNIENMAIAEAMLDAAMAAIRPGTTSSCVNQAVKCIADRNGIVLRKRAGYSMGINFAPDWGEGSFLTLQEGDQTVLEPGMVFHLPQAVRRAGEPLVASSETVVVTESGCAQLTKFERGLIEV